MHHASPFRIFQCVMLLLAFGLLCACEPFLGKKTDQVAREPSVALALPASGPYASIASRILQGARLAVQELERHGVKVRLALVDTQTKDWTSRLTALPESFRIVGGPLEATSYNTLKKNGLLDKYRVFAFLNNLNGNDEGRLAYRFFPSPRDQVDALLNFATNQLGIRSFGVFAPTDTFSTKMVGLFEDGVRRRNLSLQKALYTGSGNLAEQVKPLLNPMTLAEGSTATPVPQTAFEAIFLPASWRSLDSLLASFMYHGEDRLVLLGTMLWEQSLAGKRLASPSRYELAVFPGAWNSQARVSALSGQNPDFWLALGYDFVNFAVNLGNVAQLSPLEIKDRANRAASILRILAPMSWDGQGHAHQKLFIYRASAQGMAPMDLQLFNQMRSQRKQNAALRMQSGGTEEEPKLPDVEPVSSAPEISSTAPTPVSAPAPQASPNTIPQSSYKLRLPTRKSNP
ncbi:MAG: ABC transporter substrate-binding protein [Desulfovibrio sp.]|nr:ABC transporter substrate-binding protein [Desulfovibrio sp.]